MQEVYKYRSKQSEIRKGTKILLFGILMFALGIITMILIYGIPKC